MYATSVKAVRTAGGNSKQAPSAIPIGKFGCEFLHVALFEIVDRHSSLGLHSFRNVGR
jgi:hypothetical protein